MTNDKGILIKNIYYMLTYAFQTLRRSDFDTVAAEKFENIHDLFAAILGIQRVYFANRGTDGTPGKVKATGNDEKPDTPAAEAVL